MTDILPIVISFGEAAKPVNSGEYLVSSAADSFSNLVTIDDATVTVIDFDASAGADSTTGPHYGNNALSVAPWVSNNICYDATYLDSGNTGSYAFTSVPDGNYRLILAASRDVARGDGSRVTRFVVTTGAVSGSASVDVDAANPPSGTVAPYAEFLVAPVGGVIAFSFTAAPGSSYGYLNGAVLTKIAGTIESYPSAVRNGEIGIGYATDLSDVTAVSIGGLAAIDIDDTDGTGTHSIPPLVDETVNGLYGTKTVTITGPEGAPTTTTNFLPPDGYDYVTLSGTLDYSEEAGLFEMDPVAVVTDQIAFPDGMTYDEQGRIDGEEGEYLCWHLQSSTGIARSYYVIFGVASTAPPVMSDDTVVNVNENTTAVGTFVASSGGGTKFYTLGGPDSALFSIDEDTALVDLISPINYESGSNVKHITVTVETEFGTDSQDITVNIINVIEPPVMPADATLTRFEGTTAVLNSAATSTEGTTVYSKSGADAAAFNINTSTAALSWITPPTIGQSFSVTVRATNEANYSEQILTINVIAIPENTESNFISAIKFNANKFNAKYF